MLRLLAVLSLIAACGCQTISPESTSAAATDGITEVSAKNPIADRRLLAGFGAQLGAFKDNKKAVDAKVINQQLRERKHCQLALVAPSTEPMSSADIYRERRSSTLLVGNIYKCGRCSKWHSNLASGFAVAADVIATNFHVLDTDKAATLGVMTVDGTVYPIIEVLAGHEVADIGLARVAIPDGKQPLTPAPVAAHAPVGTTVTVISNPSSRFYTCTQGIVSRYNLQAKGPKGPVATRMTITADYAKGSSGAPVFDHAGNVCGVVSATNSIYYSKDEDGNQQNLQMVVKSCVPSASILDLIEDAVQ